MATVPIKIGDHYAHIPVVQNGTRVDVDEKGVHAAVRRKCEQEMRIAIDEREREYTEARAAARKIDAERVVKVKEANAAHEKAKAEAKERIEAYTHNQMEKLKPIRDAAVERVNAINRDYNARIAAAENAVSREDRDRDIESIRIETAERIRTETAVAMAAACTALAALTAKAETMDAPQAPVVTGGETPKTTEQPAS
jgi:hypothetical protein